MKKIILTLMVVTLGFFLIGFQPVSACECPYGVGSPGYWKNHPEAWPVEGLWSGGKYYTKEELIEWMKKPVAGDKTITMASAYIAALLNRKSDCCVPYNDFPRYNCVSAARKWLKLYPVGSGVKANSDAWQYNHGEEIYFCLDDYNNGLFDCAPSRDSLE